MKGKKMKRYILSLIMIAFLAGCGLTYDNIRPGLRAVLNDTGEVIRHETLVNGAWYDSDSSGTLTAKGKIDKDARESGGGDSGGGGGGC